MLPSIGWHLLTRLSIWMRRHRILPRTKREIYPASTPGTTDTPVRDADGLPPPPDYMLTNRVTCEMPLIYRRVNPDGDNPLDSLYRIYEHLVLDQWHGIRNEIEAFWFHGSAWLVRDIPDPKDINPERYVCLACITRLLVLAFNERIRLGLPRDAPAIFTGSMMDEWKSRLPVYESEPRWAARVPRLQKTLVIPHWDNAIRDFVPLDSFHDGKASAEFKDKNILIWQPHVHFM